jgi:hypothetical protein
VPAWLPFADLLLAGSMLRHELREGNWRSSVPIGSYNTALSRAFQLPAQ